MYRDRNNWTPLNILWAIAALFTALLSLNDAIYELRQVMDFLRDDYVED
jgi:hypothetical protein